METRTIPIHYAKVYFQENTPETPEYSERWTAGFTGDKDTVNKIIELVKNSQIKSIHTVVPISMRGVPEGKAFVELRVDIQASKNSGATKEEGERKKTMFDTIVDAIKAFDINGDEERLKAALEKIKSNSISSDLMISP